MLSRVSRLFTSPRPTSFQLIHRAMTTAPPKRELSPPPAPAPTASSSTLSLDAPSAPKRAKVELAAGVKAPQLKHLVNQGNGNKNKGRGGGKGRAKVKPHKPGGAEESGYFDTVEFLGLQRVEEMKRMEAEDGKDWRGDAEKEWGWGKDGKDIEVEVVGMSAHGDGLAILTPSDSTIPTRLIAIPFTLPGELVSVHVHRHEPDFFMSHGDLIKIVRASEERSLTEGEVVQSGEEISQKLRKVKEKYGERVRCKYFGSCSGCQYQPLSYASQLLLKQNVVRRAFANFSLLPPSLIPPIGPTLPSPLQYAYRTKLTPHFQSPPPGGQKKEGGEWEVTIGFEEKGRKRIVDIEDCVIATDVINRCLTLERENVKANIAKYKRGSTLLLRDSLPPRDPSITHKSSEPSTEQHICITDHHATVREQVGPIEFEQMAGSFFQNNSSILPSLMDYIRECVDDGAALVPSAERKGEKEKRYLIDAYCGSGLFAISLADKFDMIEGVEIDKASVKWAKKNAEFNQGEGRGEVGFRAGNAEAIFDDIKFPPSQTTILIDPPRKGCDALFISQLLKFNPACVIYVSCNVHTQARDIGVMVKESNLGDKEGLGFRIESVRAADLFANTHHAEGVAVLRRKV